MAVLWGVKWSDDARRISGCIQTLPRGREERRESLNRMLG